MVGSKPLKIDTTTSTLEKSSSKIINQEPPAAAGPKSPKPKLPVVSASSLIVAVPLVTRLLSPQLTFGDLDFRNGELEGEHSGVDFLSVKISDNNFRHKIPFYMTI